MNRTFGSLVALLLWPIIAAAGVDFQWHVSIPMRDGVRLSANVYRPKGQTSPAPCIFTLTPYIAQTYHERGMYFASRGLPFLTVDTRGRGNSEGTFRPFIQEARDGYDIVEWLAKQPYCNGKVATWGGSYAGYNQWALAKEQPPHLATIVPAASVYPGLDFPMFANMPYPYMVQWLTYTSGRTSQEVLFRDASFWNPINRSAFEQGLPYAQLDTRAGNPSAIFQEWVKHPTRDAYWDAHVPSTEQYGQLQLPILTITGSYDDDQPGALAFYREHLSQASPKAAARHYLVIGPWDHSGTRTPTAKFGGLQFGAASLLDLPKLHLDWYAWTMQAGPKPEFLKERVAYYVMGAERWRYAATLGAVTASNVVMYLDSTGQADDVFDSGVLRPDRKGQGAADRYVYDPRDVSSASRTPPSDDYLTDQRRVQVDTAKQLVYHSTPFERATEISGFFKLSAWLAIDTPDTDFIATLYEIKPDGGSIKLSYAARRARHRESLRESQLIRTREPLRYEFDNFWFVSREVAPGSRLRLVISPANSMSLGKNFNSGGVVAHESMRDARPVTVWLFHDDAHPSALHVPLGSTQR